MERRAKALETEYHELLNIAQDQNPLRLKLNQFPIVSAMVVFETPKSKTVCLNAHRQFAPYYKLNCFSKTPLDFLLRGHYHLTVSEPPEPHSIYWDNYETSMTRRIIMGVLLSVILLLCLAITWVFTMALEDQFDSINYSSYCPKQYLYAKEENVETPEEVQFIRNCFCERLNIL